ncbi:hypothetical protein SK571_39180 [Lentzea sp. BCCO 10_0798]|jgi:hypothetical protein|uniref:Uncharacterized protein n=1 Tax=Lentzea kristufekii TaxID=3095430 RepID=A0ABU4U4D4_9PSEU|nr:hypothetical protein [Lentzea sp. BCCO 10_0798]MDX8055434.1 hypothetical protein [Lentzea sp. BCCO 10_0798]
MNTSGNSQWVVHISGDAPNAHDDTRARFDDALREVLADLEQELGRTPVFALSLFQIPGEDQYWKRLKPDVVEISEGLMRSRNVLAPLESVIRELAQ